MTNLSDAATIKIDLSTPFCAQTYYAHLRAEGCDPIIGAGDWAARHDPKGTLRLEHARAAWAERTSDDEIILLGARR
ncbi:hypothetical protein [Bradyrhizobium barranii]